MATLGSHPVGSYSNIFSELAIVRNKGGRVESHSYNAARVTLIWERSQRLPVYERSFIANARNVMPCKADLISFVANGFCVSSRPCSISRRLSRTA